MAIGGIGPLKSEPKIPPKYPHSKFGSMKTRQNKPGRESLKNPSFLRD
jgi:hypothetical protein